MKRFYNNTLISGAFSKALRVIALLCVLFGLSGNAWGATITGGTTLYLDASGGGWNSDGVRFAAYVCNGSSPAKWYSMYLVEGTIYKFTVDNGESHKNVIFCRMNPNDQTNNWNNKYNQTKNLTWPGDKNLYTPTSINQEDNNDNYWSTYSGGDSGDECTGHKGTTVGFWDDEVWNIKVGDKWIGPEKGYGSKGNTLIPLGTVNPGTTIGFWTKTWKNGGNVCHVNAYVKILKGDTEIQDYTAYQMGHAANLNDAQTDQTWKNESVCSLPTEPGNYEMRVYFKINGSKEDSGCQELEYVLNNCEGDFKFSFIVSDSGSGGGGGGGTGTEFSFVLDTKTNNFGGWIANGEVYAIFRENEGGKTGETRQVLLEICESDNRLAYYNGTTTFTRTDETTWTPKEVYVYSGGNDAFANWDGTKNCMVITNWGLMTNSSGGCTMTTFTGDCDGTSGGGGGGESSTYVAFDCLYLNTGGSTLWNLPSEAVNFYLYLYNDAKGTKKSVKATVCPDASDIFYAEVPDGEWEGYLWIRKEANNNTDPAVNWNNAGVKDQTDNCSIYKDLTTITGWENANFTNGTYSGSCGCAGGSGDIDDDTEDYEKGTSVLLSYEAFEGTKGNWVLSAFLEALCAVEDITQYGFYLCETDKEGGCKPTADAYTYKVDATTTSPLEKYSSFTAIASDLNNAWYGYRAFVVADGETILSPNTKYFNNKCKYELTGDTVYVTIDNSLTVNNECELKFKSIKDAWTTLKTLPEVCKAEKVTYGWKQDKITLIKPVVMQLVPTGINYVGFEKVGLTGGDMTTVQATFFRNINMSGGAPLIVRSIDYLTNGARATLQHVAIRRSKNITLNYLNIVGASREVESADNAIDIDNGIGSGNLEGLGTDWNCASISAEDNNINANIVIKNCEIVSYGFTCVHVSAYNGITFENNDFKAMYDFEEADKLWKDEKNGITWADNTANWGASAKFLNSKNISFIRNNFTGQHATSILLQGTQKVLIYDNVFWHDNGVNTDANTVAIIRLISFGDCAGDNPLQNIGIYYNTMFLKNNTVGKGYYHHFDFFRLGGSQQTGNTENYKPATIEFDYNNCYSYDEDVKGKNYTGSDDYQPNDNTKYLQTMSESDWCGSFKYNNFWSVYDEKQKHTRSAFALGSGCNTDEGKNNFTNVQDLVCRTSPEEPGSLVIKDDGLNVGAFIKTDVSGLLTDEMQMIDRLGNKRPYDPDALEGKGTYTLGAYQQTTGEALNKIIWNGNASTDWDNRNNWYKPNGQLVTCVDVLDENLEVIIPAPRSTKYPIPAYGVKQYPTLPVGISDDTKFNDGTRSQYAGWNEEVSAGKGKVSKPTQIANTITMEYGAALIGVEQLSSGETDRYTKASSEFVAERNKWLLVGTVVKPYNEDTEDDATDTRYIKSGDYYLDHLPAVYMRQAESIVVTEEAGEPKYETKWDATFRDMDKYVLEKTVFAIKLPDQYGPYKLPAADYNFNNNTNYDPTQAHAYNFEGRFVNEANTPKYTDLAVGSYNLLVNTYPANIKASGITSGSVLIYDFNGGSFRTPGWTAANGENTSLILAQHGFAYKPTSSDILEIPSTAFEESNTMHRSAQVDLPEIRVMVKNDKYPFNSDVKISIDELKADAADPNVDASKLFTKTENKVPELYVIKYNEQWAGITLPNMDECIPLGLRMLAKNQTVTFSLNKVNGIDVAILEDRLEGKQYDLLAGETCTVSGLVKGDCEGRFFLNLGVSEDDTEEGDENVSTDVEDELSSESGIMIFGNTEGIVVSCSSDIELQTIYVNDMTGKTAKYNVSGQYAEIKLPVATGVYTVNVIGDTASKVGKVILK